MHTKSWNDGKKWWWTISAVYDINKQWAVIEVTINWEKYVQTIEEKILIEELICGQKYKNSKFYQGSVGGNSNSNISKTIAHHFKYSVLFYYYGQDHQRQLVECSVTITFEKKIFSYYKHQCQWNVKKHLRKNETTFCVCQVHVTLSFLFLIFLQFKKK